MAILQLVMIRSKDLEKARAFYEALGVKFVMHSHGGPDHLCCESHGFVFEIYPLGKKQTATVDTRLGFAVKSIRGAIAKAESVGGVVFQLPKQTPWGKRAVLCDPDGHRVEISAIPRAAKLVGKAAGKSA
jgi:catechol 2,3-dioxygenase-like lactoylglutathione lyase family enzyme